MKKLIPLFLLVPSTVFADVQEAEEALEKEKKAYPTYEQLQTKKETDEKIKQTQAQFAGSSIEEAKNIIGFLEKGKIIVDFPANFLEDTKEKYYDQIKLRPGVTQDQQKAMDFFNRYNKEQEAV